MDNGDRWKPRKKIRLPVAAYLAGEPFLLTACTAHRRQLLVGERFGLQAHQTMLAATQQTAAVLWCGIVMPDHVHLLVSTGVGKSPLDTMACFKRMTTLAVRGLGFSGPLWQRRVHDRGIRVDFANDIERAARYVLGNPVRCGLVASWQDWPLRHVNRGIDCGG